MQKIYKFDIIHKIRILTFKKFNKIIQLKHNFYQLKLNFSFTKLNKN